MPTPFSAPLAPLDERRRALILEVETLKREQNAAAEEVARRKKAGEDISALVDANRARGQQVKERDVALQALEDERRALLLTIPNVPHASRAGRARAPTTTSKSDASASRARSTSNRRRTGTSAPSLASSTSSAARRSPAPASPC